VQAPSDPSTAASRPAPWVLGAVAALAAAAVALGVAELVAVLTGPRTTPLVAVGGVVVDTVPEAVKSWAISVFGQYDKVALLVGTVLLLAAAAVGIGGLAASRISLGLAGIGAFGLIGVAAALTRPGAGPVAALPAVLGALSAAGLLQWLLAPAPRSSAVGEGPNGPATADPTGAQSSGAESPGPESSGPESEPESSRPESAGSPLDGPDRRRVLRLSGWAVGLAAVAGLAGHWLAGWRGVAQERAALSLPEPAEPVPPVPAELADPLPGRSPFVTSNADFYRIDTALVVPQVSVRDWQLRIHGRVRRPMTLSYQDLLDRGLVERYITLACVSNQVGGDLIGNARWLGVPIGPLLDEVAPEPGADQVVSRSVDGFTAGTPTAVLRDGRDALLAVGMNGEPLPVEHGFPVRLVVPGLYGYVSATKWLAELEVTSFDAFDAYWIPRGWAREAPIKTQSRIDVPKAGAEVSAGQVTVAGVAWAQRRGISYVEVRVDDGPWERVSLAPVPSVDTWRLWSWQWNATPGRHDLTVRAADSSGAVQPGDFTTPEPDGATGWHRLGVTVR